METTDPALAFETLQRWVNTGLLTGILGAVIYIGKPAIDFFIRSRQLRMDESSAEHARRMAEEQSDREGWTELIGELRKEVGMLRGENAALRVEVKELHQIINGLRRVDLTERTMRQVRALEGEEVSPAIDHALGRLDELDGRGEAE